MRFKNAVHMTADNFSAVFKTLFYRIVTGLIFFSLSYVILRMGLSVITESAELVSIKELVKEFIRAVLTADAQSLSDFQPRFTEALLDLTTLIASQTGSIIGAVIGVLALYLLARFANGLSVFAVGGILKDRASTYSRTGFSASYFRGIAKGALYELIYVPFSFAYDALTVLVCWFFFFFILSHLLSWGVFTILLALLLTVTAVVALEALKMTLISAWMPSVLLDGEGICRGFRKSFRSGKGFGRRFASYLVAVYLIIAVNAAFAVCTFGSALLLTVPLSFLFLLALQFVHYMEDNRKKYFISFRKIVGEDESGLSE